MICFNCDVVSPRNQADDVHFDDHRRPEHYRLASSASGTR